MSKGNVSPHIANVQTKRNNAVNTLYDSFYCKKINRASQTACPLYLLRIKLPSADETDIYVVNDLHYASETDDTVVSEQVQYVSEDTQGDNLTTLATTYAKDDLQRPTSTTVMQGNFGFRYNYSYVPRRTKTWVSNNGQVAYALPPIKDGYWEISDVGTTQFVSQFKQYDVSGNEETLVASDNLTYDTNGNVTKYGNVTYKYDKFNRLVRENNPTLDKTTTWCYDVSGNVCSRTEYAYTTGTVGTPISTFNYAYGNGWKDQLTAYNGQSITYDQAGNPTSYKGATLGWTRGRLLASYNSVSMQYDANGIRTRKVVPATNGSATTEYVYAGNNLLQEKVTVNQTEMFCKYFLYNSQGVVGFVQNGTTYMFRKNFFGDVTAIYRGATKVAEYAYDAWGNCTIVSDTNGIGTANPFRYRSYFWDNDLQLYYLMSRYYDPQTGRFLNADGLEYLDPETLGGLNLYAYCNNNPVNFIDLTGHDWNSFWNSLGDWFNEAGNWLYDNMLTPVKNFVAENWDIILGTVAVVGLTIYSIATFGIGTVALGMAVGAVVGAAFGAANAFVNGDNVLYGVLSGAIVGMLSGIGGPTVGGMVLAGAASGIGAFTTSIIGDKVNGRSKNYQKALINGSFTAVFSGLGNGTGNYLSKIAPSFLEGLISDYVTGLIASTMIWVTDLLSSIGK